MTQLVRTLRRIIRRARAVIRMRSRYSCSRRLATARVLAEESEVAVAKAYAHLIGIIIAIHTDNPLPKLK